MSDDNENTRAAFDSRDSYERPNLEVIQIDIEGSFLNSSTNPGNFNDRISVDDDEWADEYD